MGQASRLRSGQTVTHIASALCRGLAHSDNTPERHPPALRRVCDPNCCDEECERSFLRRWSGWRVRKLAHPSPLKAHDPLDGILCRRPAPCCPAVLQVAADPPLREAVGGLPRGRIRAVTCAQRVSGSSALCIGRSPGGWRGPRTENWLWGCWQPQLCFVTYSAVYANRCKKSAPA